MAVDTKQVQKPVSKLRKLLKKLPKQAAPEQIHDLRTNTRRLEAAMAAFLLDSAPKGQRLLKALSRVRKRSGKVRDMDVLTNDASTLNVNGEQECKVRLIEHLGVERRKKAKKLHAVVAKYGSSIRNELKQISRQFDDALAPDGNGNFSGASAKATANALKLETELSEPQLGRSNLHPYRLKVKELRNVLRLAQNADEQFLKMLGEVKDAIGDWHDWEELLGIAKDQLDHGVQCRLLRELRRRCDEKYKNALRITEDMRRKYLSVTADKGRRHSKKPPESAWNATKSLAA